MRRICLASNQRIGSGFARIAKALEDNNNPPYEVTSTNFFVIRFLPRIRSAERMRLTERQSHIYALLRERGKASKSEVARWLRASDDTALRELRALMAGGLVRREGVGKATRYGIVV